MLAVGGLMLWKGLMQNLESQVSACDWPRSGAIKSRPRQMLSENVRRHCHLFPHRPLGNAKHRNFATFFDLLAHHCSCSLDWGVCHYHQTWLTTPRYGRFDPSQIQLLHHADMRNRCDPSPTVHEPSMQRRPTAINQSSQWTHCSQTYPKIFTKRGKTNSRPSYQMRTAFPESAT